MSTAQSLVPVTPSDTVLLPAGSVALYVGQSGNLSVLPAVGDTPVVLSEVQGGSVLPIKVRRVDATGTTASGIVALY